MNIGKIIFFTSVLLTSILLFTQCASCGQTNEYGIPINPPEIEFALYGGLENNANDLNIEYDDLVIQSKVNDIVNKQHIYVYGDPVIDDFSTAAKFGFDVNNFKSFGTDNSGERWYDLPDGSYMRIDRYGCFSWSSGEQDGSEPIELSDEQCVKKAADYLREHNLWNENISENATVSYVQLSGPENEQPKTVAVGVFFIPKPLDGIQINGNFRIYVRINSRGTVNNVTYNWREYGSRQYAELISTEEALTRVREGKALFEGEYVGDSLVIDDVFIGYWAQNRNQDNLFMQPVYVFNGNSTDKNGRDWPVYITVQANRV